LNSEKPIHDLSKRFKRCSDPFYGQTIVPRRPPKKLGKTVCTNLGTKWIKKMDSGSLILGTDNPNGSQFHKQTHQLVAAFSEKKLFSAFSFAHPNSASTEMRAAFIFVALLCCTQDAS
jgi:hypothetical protein